VRLVCSTENVDYGNENPLAKFLLSLLALLAELERHIIVERSQSGQEERVYASVRETRLSARRTYTREILNTCGFSKVLHYPNVATLAPFINRQVATVR
jgi:DNA invertase Pin-like site-specific DNA recombinase